MRVPWRPRWSHFRGRGKRAAERNISWFLESLFIGMCPLQTEIKVLAFWVRSEEAFISALSLQPEEGIRTDEGQGQWEELGKAFQNRTGQQHCSLPWLSPLKEVTPQLQEDSCAIMHNVLLIKYQNKRMEFRKNLATAWGEFYRSWACVSNEDMTRSPYVKSLLVGWGAVETIPVTQ